MGCTRGEDGSTSGSLGFGTSEILFGPPITDGEVEKNEQLCIIFLIGKKWEQLGFQCEHT
jgi:hypothetical protein